MRQREEARSSSNKIFPFFSFPLLLPSSQTRYSPTHQNTIIMPSEFQLTTVQSVMLNLLLIPPHLPPSFPWLEDNYGQSYEISSSGNNDQGNHYCSRDYGGDSANSNSYHCQHIPASHFDSLSLTSDFMRLDSNSDGSYYYSNSDGSTCASLFVLFHPNII